MMNKIENAHQLRKEIVRLQTELEKKELKLQSSFNTVKEDFKPETFIVKAISSATGINFAKGDFLQSGLMATISLVLRRFVFKQESVLERKILSWAQILVDKLRAVKTKVED